MERKINYSKLPEDIRYSSSESSGDESKLYESTEPFLQHASETARPHNWVRKSLLWVLHGVFILTNITLLFVQLQSFPSNKRWSSYQPLNDSMVEYNIKVFDQGHGENNPLNASERIMYSGKTTPEVDESWLELYYPISRIKLTKQEVDAAGLNTVTYKDGSGYVSSLDVAHQLHCLDEIRKSLAPDAYPAMLSPAMQADHIAHCINYLRQALMCNGDTTLLEYHDIPYEKPGSYRQRTDFTSPHKCRSYKKIFDWAMTKRVTPEERDLIHYPYEPGKVFPVHDHAG